MAARSLAIRDHIALTGEQTDFKKNDYTWLSVTLGYNLPNESQKKKIYVPTWEGKDQWKIP